MSNSRMIILCYSCAEMLEEAGYIVNEVEPCENREKCFWCKKRGWYSLYNSRRENNAETNRGEKRTEEGAESYLPVSSQH